MLENGNLPVLVQFRLLTLFLNQETNQILFNNLIMIVIVQFNTCYNILEPVIHGYLFESESKYDLIMHESTVNACQHVKKEL